MRLKHVIDTRTGIGLILVAGCLAVLATDEKQTDTPPIDPEVYKEFMSAEVGDIYDLEQFFIDQQDTYLPIIPPDPDFILHQSGSPYVLPFTWDSFPPEFNENLVLTYENSVPVYKVTILEDFVTRETVFLNADGDRLFALPPLPAYDPFSYLRTIFASLYDGRYNADQISYWQRFYDPARIQINVKLLPSEYAEHYLYVSALIANTSTRNPSTVRRGMSKLRSLEAESNIVFEAVSRTNGGIRMAIGYPNSFTNRLDVFTCNDLMQYVWTFATRELSTTGTNEIAWVDTNYWISSGPPVRLYAAGNADLDTDLDGCADAREIMVYLTDFTNSDSRPVGVSGVISYSGIETGTIFALSVTSSGSWSIAQSVALSAPGAYSNDIGNSQSYWFKAFRDANTNYAREDWEPWGIYSNAALAVTANVSGINITMQDQPSIWGAVDYTGSETGDIHVIAVTASNSWDTTHQCVISWIQGQQSQTGGEIYVTFPAEYSITGLPSSNYWIRAFMDSDTNGAFTHLEAAGQYSSNSIPVSHRFTGIDFTLGQDTDSDGMPDWWEWQNGFNPASTNDAGQDADSDASSNLSEYGDGTDPLDSDTDGDCYLDGEEAGWQTDPLDFNSMPPLGRGVVINEVVYNPTDADTGKEWAELFNTNRADVNLGGFIIQVASNSFTNAYTFPTGTVIRSGDFLLIGGSLVTNADHVVELNMINRFSYGPTAGLRLVAPDAVTNVVVDTLLYAPTNTFGLPTTGFGTDGFAPYAAEGQSLARIFVGYDTDHASDWKYTTNMTPFAEGQCSDIDGDGISNSVEIAGYTSVFGFVSTDFNNADTDFDGLSDGEESTNQPPTNPLDADTDDDSFPWSTNGYYFGSDGDEVNNANTDPANSDCDGDGLPDGWEIAMGLSPTNTDSDSDSVLDADEDTDGDGVTNAEEMNQNSNPMDSGDSVSHDYRLVLYHQPQDGWVSSNDMGTLTWVGYRFENILSTVQVAFVVADGGYTAETFSVEWVDATNTGETGGRTNIVWATLLPGTTPEMIVRDGGTTWPNESPYERGADLSITAFRVDLDIDANYDGDIQEDDENIEQSVGGAVGVNFDDDDWDDNVDQNETSSVLGEDDLQKTTLKVQPVVSSGTVKLETIYFGVGRIAIWAGGDKTTLVSLTNTWDLSIDMMPSNLWIEGVSPSTNGARDIEIHLSYTKDNFSCTNIISVTVCELFYASFGYDGQTYGWPPTVPTEYGSFTNHVLSKGAVLRGSEYVLVRPIASSFLIRIANAQTAYKAALHTQDAYIGIIDHANTGLGPAFDTTCTSISDFFNVGTPFAAIDYELLHNIYPSFSVAPEDIANSVTNYNTIELGVERYPNCSFTNPPTGWPMLSDVPAGVSFPTNYLRTGYEKMHFYIDDNDYTCPSTSHVALLVIAGAEDKPTLKYQKLFLNQCRSGRRFSDVMNHGVVFYNHDINSQPTFLFYLLETYLDAVLDGKSNAAIEADLDSGPDGEIYSYKEY